MKINLGKIIVAMAITGIGFSAKAAICESTDGWKVNTTALDVANSRIGGDGNTWVTIHHPTEGLVANFTATSQYAGENPLFQVDNYVIHKFLLNNIGLKSFAKEHYWETDDDCWRSRKIYWVDSNKVFLITDSGLITLTCK